LAVGRGDDDLTLLRATSDDNECDER